MSVQAWPPKTYLFGDVWCFVGSKTVQNQKTWGKTTPQKVRKYPAKVRKYPQKYANQISELCLFQNSPNLINNDPI